MAYDFPNAPLPGQVFQNWTWDSEKWVQTGNPAASGAVRYDLPQGLNTSQMALARANISVTKKNYIINGAMMISQESGATVGTTSGYYAADQFGMAWNMTPGVISAQQIVSYTLGGSPNRLRFTASTANTSVAAGYYVNMVQILEGLRFSDMKFGTPTAKTFTLQFGVKAPAGTYCVSFLNAAVTRVYVAEYIITAGQANADAVISLTIPGCTDGVWAADNTVGMYVRWALMAGTTYQQAAGSWSTSGVNAMGSPNQFNFMGTAGNIFELFDVSLTEGSVAPPFQVPDYASELLACKRYYNVGITSVDGYAPSAGFAASMRVVYGVQMRAAPTMTATNISNVNCGTSGGAVDIQGDSFKTYRVSSAAGAFSYGEYWFAKARL